jgi:hypothetical protein
MLTDPIIDQADHSPRKRAVFKLVAYPLIVVILYILSAGPVLWAQKQGWVPAFVFYFYAPLACAWWHSALANHVLDWYLKLWGVD